jgi:hypothetical protein
MTSRDLKQDGRIATHSEKLDAKFGTISDGGIVLLSYKRTGQPNLIALNCGKDDAAA